MDQKKIKSAQRGQGYGRCWWGKWWEASCKLLVKHFVQVGWIFAREMTTQEKALLLGLFFFCVTREKQLNKGEVEQPVKNSQHITLKSNMSPFEMVPFYGTCWFSGVYIFKVSWSIIMFPLLWVVSVRIPSANFFPQCHHQDSYEFLGNRKKRLNSIEEDKPNKLMLLLGIEDRNDHSKIPQGKMVLWMFDAKKTSLTKELKDGSQSPHWWFRHVSLISIYTHYRLTH